MGRLSRVIYTKGDLWTVVENISTFAVSEIINGILSLSIRK